MSDLLTTGSFFGGRLECRRDIDLAITSNGDLALTPDDETTLFQQLMMYLFTPKNERPGLPQAGCILPEIMHDRITRGVLKRINGSVAKDIRSMFPNFRGVQVACRAVPNSTSDIFVTIIMPTGRVMDLIADFEQVMKNAQVMADTFRW